LNREGVATFGKSKGWHKSYVQKLLKNTAVLGEFQLHKTVAGKKGRRKPVGEPLQQYYPPIIDHTLFYKAQAARNAHKIDKDGTILSGGGRKGAHYSNLFTGLLRCANCKGTICFVNKGPSSGSFLFCDNARRGIGFCSTTGWKYDDFESKFLRYVEETRLGEIIGEIQPDHDKRELHGDIKALEGQLFDLEEKRERAYNLYIDQDQSEHAKTRYGELDVKVKEIKETLAQKRELLAQISFKEVAFSHSKQEIDALVRKLQSEKTGETFKLRSAIANHFRDIIKVIGVHIQPQRFPGSGFVRGQENRAIAVMFRDGKYRIIPFGERTTPWNTNRMFASNEELQTGNFSQKDRSDLQRSPEGLRKDIGIFDE
jgi:hypothetical protein